MTYIYCSKNFSNIDFLRMYVLKTLLDEAHVQYKYFCDQPSSSIKCNPMKNIKFKDDDVIAFVKADAWFIEKNFKVQKKLLFTKIPCYNNTVLFDFKDDASYVHQIKTLDLLFFCTDEMLEKICGQKKELNDKAILCLCDDMNKLLVDEDIKKNGRFQINVWDKFTKFAKLFLDCNFIYTDCADGIALSISLNKKLKFYFPHGKTAIAKTSSVFSYFGMKMKGSASVNNAHIQQQLQNGRALMLSCITNIFKPLKTFSKKNMQNMHMQASSMTIADYSTSMMSLGTCPLRFYNKKEQSKKKTYDFTVIQAFFGNENSTLHIEAAKNAIQLNLNYSNDTPKQWIFIEYSTHEFEYLKQFGIEYYHIDQNPKSDGLFMKECLWNIAWRKYAKSENLCFIDADVVYLDCDWVKKTYDGFKKYDAFQNYTFNIRTEAKKDNNAIKESAFFTFKKKLPYLGDTGLNICIKEDILKKINGFLSCPLSGADFVYVYLLLGHCSTDFPIYLDHHAKKGYQLNIIFRKELEFGYCDTIILHWQHSADVKDYEILNMLQRRCGSYYQKIFEENSDGLIQWSNTHAANICKNTYKKINAVSAYTYDSVEKCVQNETIKEYGQIDDEHPLLFVTCFNPGVNISTKQVLQTKMLLDKYCLDRHDFICITNEDIPGVKCIPISKLDITSADFQMEMWHCNYIDNPDTSVMYIDLDIVPLDYFRLPRCPKDTIWMVDENQLTLSYGTKYNFGCIYFNGKLDFIYNEIVQNFDRIYKYYNDLQPFVTHLLLNHGIQINNLYNFVNLAFVGLSWKSIPKLDGCQFIHFIGNIKPWNFTNKRYKDIIDSNIVLRHIRNFYNSHVKNDSNFQ